MASSVYQAWSVIAGETPTTAKWNLLGSNDASFNTGVGFNDAIILARHFASGALPITTTNGMSYITLGGLMIVWATQLVSNAGTTFTFPVSFSANPTVVATVYDSNNQTAWITYISASQVTLKQLFTGNALNVNWIAIGPK